MLLLGMCLPIFSNKLLRNAETSLSSVKCFLCNEGLYKFILSFAILTFSVVEDLPYLDLTKYSCSALVAVKLILLPDGIVHWHAKLVLLGRVAPLATAASTRKSIPTTWLQLPSKPATQVQYADKISPPGFSVISLRNIAQTSYGLQLTD